MVGIIDGIRENQPEMHALLDEANTSTYGHPVPTKVSMKWKRPVHRRYRAQPADLEQLLEQTNGKGVNIYTHGECCRRTAIRNEEVYHLKGNFGTAWQNQQKEFANLPVPILFTTNCLMPPKPSYAENVFTTSMVGYPGLKHIHDKVGKKDFSR